MTTTFNSAVTDAHWPTDGLEVGSRVEVGLARDRAWDDLASRVRIGALLAVDYGHRRSDRPRHGTLTGYRDGSVVAPVADGSCDLTAHVAVDSLVHDVVLPQGAALRELGIETRVPRRELARTDPAAYLAALARASAATAVVDPSGLGGFPWVLRRVGRG